MRLSHDKSTRREGKKLVEGKLTRHICDLDMDSVQSLGDGATQRGLSYRRFCHGEEILGVFWGSGCGRSSPDVNQ